MKKYAITFRDGFITTYLSATTRREARRLAVAAYPEFGRPAVTREISHHGKRKFTREWFRRTWGHGKMTHGLRFRHRIENGLGRVGGLQRERREIARMRKVSTSDVHVYAWRSISAEGWDWIAYVAIRGTGPGAYGLTRAESISRALAAVKNSSITNVD